MLGIICITPFAPAPDFAVVLKLLSCFVIANNKARKGKNLWTDADGGEKIEVYTAPDEQGHEQELIMFGDEGGCQFFIPADKLRARDFSDVMYSWDCG